MQIVLRFNENKKSLYRACFVITAAWVISSPAPNRPVGCVCDTAVVWRVSCNSRPLRTPDGGVLDTRGCALLTPG